MTLEKENIRLRAVESSDLENLYLWENNIEVWKVSQTISPFSKYTLKEYCSVAKTHLQGAKQLRLMIDVCEKSGITTVGMIDVFDYDAVNQKAGIGILIGDTKFRHKKIASTAIEILVKYAFSILNLHQLYCFISENNRASIDLFLKQKFEICGTIKDWILYSNKWEKVCFLQIINK
ncbi:MAG: GNAT family N-acetyltransferase [Bacteroidetes bacterium CG23_combo_of_CG06-09_8_20_14_all_32_9]|nr:MAG: GNAT family N-acetyltransferase [Bacteroidetes bacterium CG23_combo_of_CG06-09_8_20_14_all_32_9]